jgi:hypothetical protein
MWPRWPSFAATGAAICAAFALWVSFGALAFVPAEADVPFVTGTAPLAPLGILPSLLWLTAFVVVAALFSSVVRPSPRAMAPLWLSAVLLLPWLPVRLPLSVFIWTGNAAWWVWAAIVLALLARAVAPLIHGGGFLKMPPRKAALIAGLLAAAAYGATTWAVAPQHPDGDEPHYLIITQSLLEDHDLKIENNHRQGDYRAYLDRTIKPDFLKRGTDGQIYSIHAPGLPALVAPAFALFGYPGVLAELVLLSAIASAVAWLVAWRATLDAAAAWFGWAAVSFSVPFLFHASAVFPDGIGAVLALAAVPPLVDRRAREAPWLFVAGGALGMMPWVSSRFIVLVACAGLVVAVRVIGDRSRVAVRLAALAICPAISAIALLAFFQIIYGTPNPSVVYANSPTMTMNVGNLARGVPGLLFDQQFGVLPSAPVFLCAFAGLVLMAWRGRRRLAIELLLIVVPYYLTAVSFTSWWGGTTAPARYFAPVTLLLAVPAAWWFATARGTGARVAGVGALVVSLFISMTIAAVDRGTFVFNFRDGMSRVALWLTPVVDLSRALPSLFQNPPALVMVQTAVWSLALALALAVAVARGRRGYTSALVAFGLTLEATTMGATSAVWRSNHVNAARPYAGGAALLERLEPGAHQVALAYRPFRRLDTADVAHRIVLATMLPTEGGRESAALSHLPPGVYEITGTVVGAPAGHLRLRTDRVSGPLADWDVTAFEPRWTRQIDLPAGLASLILEADTAARQSVRDVTVRAVSRSDMQADVAGREAKRAARYGPALLFLLGGDAWVEPGGTWVAAGSHADFAIAPDAGSPIHLFVRNSPVPNEIDLTSGSWHESLALQPGEERVLEVPRDVRGPLTPLAVSTRTGFRPAAVDPKSADERLLGAWIETR